MSHLPDMSHDEIQARIQERTRRQSEELAQTRERAANWSKGVGALLLAALAFSLIKGRDDLTSLDATWAKGVGVCLVVAAVVATFAAYKLFRASYGPLKPLADEVTDHQESTTTMNSLAVGLGLSALAFAGLLGAVGATWYGPDAKGPRIAVTDEDGTVWCGEPKSTGDGNLVLNVKVQEMEFDLNTVSRLEAVDTCPK